MIDLKQIITSLISEVVNINDINFEKNLLNNSGVIALNLAAAIFNNGLTNKTRDWFAIGLPINKDNLSIYDDIGVKQEAEIIKKLYQNIFVTSNFYSSIYTTYLDTLGFGTSVMGIVKDIEKICRFSILKNGTWTLAKQSDNIDTIYIWKRISGGQLLNSYNEYGLIPDNIKSLALKSRNKLFKVRQIIEPNENYNSEKEDIKSKKYKSYHILEEHGVLIKESGYSYFPFVISRFENTNDIYSLGLGALALGDIYQLQEQEEHKLKTQAYNYQPPLVADEEFKNILDLSVGTINYVPLGQRNVNDLVGSLIKPNFLIRDIDGSILRVEDRIKNTFFNNLLLLSLADKSGRTAEEVARRQDEQKILVLSVAENLISETLDPIFDRVFYILEEEGYLDVLKLKNMAYPVEYISELALLQKMTGYNRLSSYWTFIQALLNIPQFKSLLDEINISTLHKEIRDVTLVNPNIINTKSETDIIRSERIKAEEQMAKMQYFEGMSNGLKNMGSIPQDNLNLLMGAEGNV